MWPNKAVLGPKWALWGLNHTDPTIRPIHLDILRLAHAPKGHPPLNAGVYARNTARALVLSTDKMGIARA